MKNNLKFLSLGLFLVFCFTNNLNAQSDKPVETSFTVEGVCDMCKSRIENAALIKGVKYAKWDKEAQSITVVYKPGKVEELTIHEAIAAVGHDTEKVKAKDEVYKTLPGCCAFRDGVEVH